MAKAKEESPQSRAIWYIGFRPIGRPLPWPWRWFIRPDFAHVMAFRFDPRLSEWIFVEWSGMTVFVEVWPGENMDGLFTLLKHEGALISYEAESHLSEWKFRMPFYCVSWVKHLLSLRGCAAVTPYQLFCALKKRGGTVIFEDGRSTIE